MSPPPGSAKRPPQWRERRGWNPPRRPLRPRVQYLAPQTTRRLPACHHARNSCWPINSASLERQSPPKPSDRRNRPSIKRPGAVASHRAALQIRPSTSHPRRPSRRGDRTPETRSRPRKRPPEPTRRRVSHAGRSARSRPPQKPSKGSSLRSCAATNRRCTPPLRPPPRSRLPLSLAVPFAKILASRLRSARDGMGRAAWILSETFHAKQQGRQKSRL